MDSRRLAILAGIGCAGVVLLGVAVMGAILLFPIPVEVGRSVREEVPEATLSASEVTREVSQAVPTLTPVPEEQEGSGPAEDPYAPQMAEGSLASLYERAARGVVNVRVYVDQGGMTGTGAGSGFVIDDDGHIVTNDHVVAQASAVTVVFYDGFEARAEIVGTDADSDLAIVRADMLPEGVQPLEVAGSDAVKPGDWVVAIGNPFSLGGSMSLGIVSALGRVIPTADTPFSIPQAVQTDAAVNPGNSGGPLLNLDGQVVGVNAQIASSTGTNSGVGFAIPANVVRRVIPALIENGNYVWPWLGVSGAPVNLLIQEANDLDEQRGAYIGVVLEDSPASQAGLRGASGQRSVLGQDVPVGGDVVLEADGQRIEDFTDLLVYVAFKRPGDIVTLTVLRDGNTQQVAVELAARPE